MEAAQFSSGEWLLQFSRFHPSFQLLVGPATSPWFSGVALSQTSLSALMKHFISLAHDDDCGLPLFIGRVPQGALTGKKENKRKVLNKITRIPSTTLCTPLNAPLTHLRESCLCDGG